MARAGGSTERIGRTPPAVTLAGGTIAASTLLTDGSTDAVAIPVSPARAGDDALVPGEGTAAAAARYGIDLAEIGERARLAGNPGDVYVLQLPAPRRVVGPPPVGRAAAAARAGRRGRRASRRPAPRRCRARPRHPRAGPGGDHGRRRGAADRVAGRGRSARGRGGLPARGVRAVADHARRTTSKAPAELVLLGRDGTRAAAAVGAARTAATATWLVRDLATTPSNTKNPEWMAEQARRLGRRGRARRGRPGSARARRVRRDPGGRRAGPRRRRGSSPSATRPRRSRRGPASTSWSSARASRTTRAACPSSRATPWCR